MKNESHRIFISMVLTVILIIILVVFYKNIKNVFSSHHINTNLKGQVTQMVNSTKSMKDFSKTVNSNNVGGNYINDVLGGSKGTSDYFTPSRPHPIKDLENWLGV